MNALELADELETIEPNYTSLDEAAAMIRQQHSEIEALKQQIKNLESQVYGGTTK